MTDAAVSQPPPQLQLYSWCCCVRLRKFRHLILNFLDFPDGLTDCADSNCCSQPSCQENIMCVYFADPVDVLLRKPPPSVSASFFQKVQFLIEGDKSVQSYAKREFYDEKWVFLYFVLFG